VLQDRFDTPMVSVILAGVGFLLATAVAVAGGLSRRTVGATALCAILATAGCAALAPRLFDRLWERLQYKREDDGSRFARLLENRHGVIAVDQTGVVFGGGDYDGAFSVDPVHDRNGIYRAYAVGVLHPRPARVLLIGLGSGSWAQVLANLPGVERLTAIDINDGYQILIGERPEVASVLRNPRVELVVDDARRWLARHPERRFDAIVSNVMLHWRANSTGLLSREFTALVKSRLEPGGLYAFNTSFFRPARETALAQFAHGALLGTFLYVSDEPLTLDADAWRRLLRETRIDGREVVGEAGNSPLPFLHRVARDSMKQIVTDDNMLPEWRGAPFHAHEHPATPGRP
jgi:spermidine synthase